MLTTVWVKERDHPRCPGEKQYGMISDISRDDFLTEIKTVVEQQASMDGADLELYMKLIQTVMSNGMGMEAVALKRPVKTPKPKSEKAECLSCLKLVEKAFKDEDDILTVSEKSSYASGMRKNLQALRVSLKNSHLKLLDATTSMDEDQFKNNFAETETHMKVAERYCSDRMQYMSPACLPTVGVRRWPCPYWSISGRPALAGTPCREIADTVEHATIVVHQLAKAACNMQLRGQQEVDRSHQDGLVD